MRAVSVFFVAGCLLCGRWVPEERLPAVIPAHDVRNATSPAPAASGTPSQPKASGDSISSIEKSCGEILARNKTAPPDYSFGRDDPNGGTPGAWQEFATPADLAKLAANASFEDQAWVWKDNGNVVHAKITLPTEDGTTVADYCFRPDGTIAEITSDVENFTVNQINRREWEFDSRERVVNIGEKFLDLNTGKQAKPERDFTEVDTEIYLTVKDLPFAPLIPKTDAPH